MPEQYFSLSDKEAIHEAIEQAELNTSGEVRVHIESRCKGDVMDRAAEVFQKLHMHETELRNGVLIYLALRDHQFAILGDAGINAVVPDHFWEDAKEEMQKFFREGKITEGLCTGIKMAGKQLKEQFPYRTGDVNELTNEISFGAENKGKV